MILASYLILALLVYISVRVSLFQEYLMWFVVVATLFLIRDSLILFGIPKNSQYSVFEWSRFYSEMRGKNAALSKWNAITVINRQILFPFILVIGIFLLVLRQIDGSFSQSIQEYSWYEYLIFVLFVFTTFWTLFGVESTDRYIHTRIQSWRMRMYVLWSAILSLITAVIVFTVSSSLWLLSIPVSIISGVLLFTIGITQLAEEKS